MPRFRDAKVKVTQCQSVGPWVAWVGVGSGVGGMGRGGEGVGWDGERWGSLKVVEGRVWWSWVVLWYRPDSLVSRFAGPVSPVPCPVWCECEA